MIIDEKDGNTVLSELTDFDINKIFDCGQCFRFEPVSADTFGGVAHGRYLEVTQKDGEATLHDMTKREFESVWFDYFNLGCDYASIRNSLSTDDIIINAMQKGCGIRILKQELFETVISFIVSQNNNIPRIKKIINALCQNYGSPFSCGGDNVYYAFPSVEALASANVSDLHALGCGYRDEYISGFARSVAEGKFSLDALNALPTPQAREMLLSVKGIGGKVADCILLFGMARHEVCPHDVWVKRIFTEKYGVKNITEKKGYALASGKWGGNAGIAQQYLFYAERG